MIKNGLLLFIFLTGMTIFFVSCLSDGGNRTTSSAYAVMVYNTQVNGLTMNTPTPVFVPELEAKVKAGDCMWVNFTIDYDNQPAGKIFYTASNVTYEPINKRLVREEAGSMKDSYIDSIRSIVGILQYTYYDEKVFIQTEQLGTAKQLFVMEMIYNPDSVDINGVPAIYLKSKKDNEAQGSELVSVNTVEAFDFRAIFRDHGKDSIVVDQSTKEEMTYRYIKFNLKYQSGMKNGEPVYTQFEYSPMSIFALKKDN